MKKANEIAEILLSKVNNPEFSRREAINVYRNLRAEYQEESAEIAESCRNKQLLNGLSRTGILPIHEDCDFDNYEINNDKQKAALEKAKLYAAYDGYRNFIFSGRPGTGKNHLATAICKEYLSKNKSALLITVTELIRNFKEAIGSDKSESSLIDKYSKLDLLVIDEIGLAKQTEYVNQILNEIIDKRQCYKRSTGVLTNLPPDDLREYLGQRIIDRLAFNGMWVGFDWDSHRRKKS